MYTNQKNSPLLSMSRLWNKKAAITQRMPIFLKGLPLFILLLLFQTTVSSLKAQRPDTIPGTAASASKMKREQATGPTLAAVGGLQQIYSATGHYTLSADGAGSLNASTTIRVNKPNASATVQTAILMSTGTNTTISNGCITIGGTAVNWNGSASGTAPGLTFYNYWANVTSIVSSTINAAPAGTVNFPLTECSSGGIEGEALLVVFNDPTATEKTVVIMFGAQNPTGDNFSLTLAQPINPSTSGALFDMGLGIGYSYQQFGGNQRSYVSVNGKIISSSAGGEDDGTSANGALITVGGIGDLNTNPTDPNAGPTNPRTDDELYSILPFITNTTTSLTVTTSNPSLDDNIFLAYFAISGAAIVGEGILLSQTSTSGNVGTSHTVKASVLNTDGVPIANRLVTFTITSGPNAGNTFSVNTNASGEAFYTYTGSGGVGTDIIQACFINSSSVVSCSNNLSFQWIGAPTCDLSAIDLGPNKTVNLFYADSTCTTLSLKGLDSSVLPSYTFKWSTGDTTSTIKVCPTATTKYVVVVSKGTCTISDTVTVFVEQCPKDLFTIAPSCSSKVTLTWKEPINTYPSTITIPQSLDYTNGSLTLLDTLGGHGYYKSNNKYLWPDARDISSYLGGNGVNGHLVTITDSAENQFVWDHIKNSTVDAWIGLYNTGKVGKFKWVTNETFDYANWITGQPDNYGGDAKNVAEPYVQIHDYMGHWNDNSNVNEPFVTEFEKPLIRYKQISGPANGSSRGVGVYTICYQRTNLITDISDTCCFTFSVSCPPSLACPKDTVIAVASCINNVPLSWKEPADTFPSVIQAPQSLDPSQGMLTYIGALAGHGYYKSNNAYLWPIARDISSYLGGNGVNGHLVTITDTAENQFVWDHVKNLSVDAWIGLYNTGNVGKFKWVTNETFNYNNWITGQPDNYGGDAKNVAEPYVQIHDNMGQWNDNSNVYKPFVAEFEKPLIKYKQIAGPTIGSLQKPGVYLICYQRNNLITDQKDTCCFTVTLDCSGATLITNAITNVTAGKNLSTAALNGTDKKIAGEIATGELQVTAYPNPSKSQFILNITSGNPEKVSLRLFDMIGRSIESQDELAPNQTLKIGGSLTAGIYFVQLKQGGKNVVIKIVKE